MHEHTIVKIKFLYNKPFSDEHNDDNFNGQVFEWQMLKAKKKYQ